MKASLPLPPPKAKGTHRAKIRSAVGPLLFLVSVCFCREVCAQVSTQKFVLQPGWNAVWLEVQPADNSTATVFANLPVASVWTRAERLSPVDFIQNPSEQAFNKAGWLGWFPPSRAEAFLGNLFSVQANHAYLLKLTNAVPITWSVSGRPSLRTSTWVPDSYNLRGLPIDPASPPTFVNFFRPSKAHYDTSSGQLQKIYKLTGGQWTLTTPAEFIVPGQAYWIYTKGASEYQAPLGATVDLGDGLDYGTELTELNLRLRNLSTGTITASLHDAGTGASPLAYYEFHTDVGVRWPALPNPLVLTATSGVENRLRLAVRRQDLTSDHYASVLEVRNGGGTRFLIPVSAEKFTGAVASPGGISPASVPEPMAGLWVGTATINAIAEAHSANPSNPTPTKSELNLRLILHVDDSGRTRLLKEVIQMWRDGTYTNDSAGNRVVDKPGQYVLLTDDSLIPLFNGAALRDGQSVGRRISTMAYDFATASTNNFLNLTGTFAVGQNLSGTLTMPYDSATNPFKHKYHPDHDNLNARFDGPAVEAYATTRLIELDFTATPPSGPAGPDFGYNEMGGNYHEVIIGIHRRAIPVSGTFRVSRVSLIGQLNPNPAP